MQKFKNLNNLPDEIIELIPKLERGQEVVFQMLNGQPNNDMDRGEREKNPILYGKTQLSTRYTIRASDNKQYQVGAPMGVDNDVVLSYRPFLAGMNDGVFQGKFSLIGGNAIDEELFEVFWLSPEREGCPFPDQKVRPLFRIINHKEEAQKTTNKIETLRKALDILKAMSEQDYRSFAASQNWSETDIDFIQAKVGDFAKGTPEKFIAIVESPETKTKATLKAALDKNILTYDAITGDVLLGESVLLRVAKDKKPEYLAAIASWVASAKNGKSVYDGIVKQLESN